MTTQGVEPISKDFLITIENKIKSKAESEESIIEELSKANDNELTNLYKHKFDSGRTLLHLTVKNHKYNLLEWLLENNVTQHIDINAGDKSGFTVLHLAVINNNATCARLLIKHRADPFLQDRRKRSAWNLYQDLKSDRDPNFKYAFMHIELPDKTLLERYNNPELIEKLQGRFNELSLTTRSTDPCSSIEILAEVSEHSSESIFDSISLATQTKRNIASTFRNESYRIYYSHNDSSSTLNSLSTVSIASSSSSSSSSSFASNRTLNELLTTPNVEEFRNYLLTNDNLEKKINGSPLIFHVFISTLSLAHVNREHYEQAFLQFVMLFKRIRLSDLTLSQSDEEKGFSAFLEHINKEHGFTTTTIFKFINELKQYFANQLTIMRSESFKRLNENNDILESFLIQRFGDLKAMQKTTIMDEEMSRDDKNETKLRKALNWLIKYDLKYLFEISTGLTDSISPNDLLRIIKTNYKEFTGLEKCVSILIVKNIALHMLDCTNLSLPFHTDLLNKFLNIIIDDECDYNPPIETFFSYLLELSEEITPLYLDNISELNSWFQIPSIKQKIISFEKMIETAAICDDIKIQKKLIQICANEIKALSLETLQSINFSQLKRSNTTTHSKRFDNFCAFIVKQVVSAPNDFFFKYYKVWVHITDALLTPVEGLGPDLGAALVILNALESKAVCHRKIAFPKIDSEFYTFMTDLRNLCSPSRNFHNFSAAIQAYQNPLPHLGMFLSQITRAHEYDGPFNKICALGKMYYTFLPLQRSLFSFPIIQDSDLKEILDLPHPNLDELYYKACQFVPFKIYLNKYEGDRVIGELKNCMLFSLSPQFIQNEQAIKSKDTFFELCRYVFSEIYFGHRTGDDLVTLAEYQKYCGINYSPLISELSAWIFEQMRTQYFRIDKGMRLLYKYIDILNPSMHIDWETSVIETAEETVYCNPLYLYRGSMQKLEEKPDVQKSSSSSSSDSIRNSRKRASSTLKRNISSKGSTLFPKFP